MRDRHAGAGGVARPSGGRQPAQSRLHVHGRAVPQLRQRDAALTAYKDQLDKIEKTYEKDLETIKVEREKKYQEYLHQFIRDPKQLAKDVEELFGFEYVE